MIYDEYKLEARIFFKAKTDFYLFINKFGNQIFIASVTIHV